MAVLVEVIGRRTGVGGRPARSIEFEQVRLRPYVGRIMGDVDGDVADQADPFRCGVFLECAPLAVEDELLELRVADVFIEGGIVGVLVS